MQDFDIILLLNKRFTGEITAAEVAVLDAWIGQSPENARLATQYQQVWDGTTERPKHFEVDMDAEFRRLLSRIDVVERPAVPVVPISRQLLRAAAAVAFLLFATWGYRQFMAPAPRFVFENAQNVPKRLIELPDGSKVWLRQNAEIQYPQTFSSTERRVKLSGEAYFDVAHRAEQPFRVELEAGGVVEVLGTRFNIRTTATNAETSILVREGKVRYSPEGEGDEAVLAAGDKAVCRRDNPQIFLSKVPTFNELAWQTGQLEFTDTPLRQVLADLETYFDVEIDLRNSAILECRHTDLFAGNQIDDVLQKLALVYQFKVANPAPGRYRLIGGICK
ncbi:MAG: FecR domain-containing protein [Lewinellaceae bacterium]|nr:FecR domain-containing protein [Lewinellaceae bacterium]